MAQQPWNRSDLRGWHRLQQHLVSASIALALLLLVVVGLFSPSLEAVAQRIAQFFTVTTPDQVWIEMPAANLNVPETRFSLSVAEASEMAGFKLKEPQSLPPEYSFYGADVNKTRGAVTLNYQTDSGLVLWLTQRSIGLEYQRISVRAMVEKVKIGIFEGEYVEGGWITSQPVDQDPTPAHTVTLQAVWDPDANIHFLRWQENDILYELFFSGKNPDLPGYLNKEDLISIAENLK
jgi:hypothetical protein